MMEDEHTEFKREYTPKMFPSRIRRAVPYTWESTTPATS